MFALAALVLLARAESVRRMRVVVAGLLLGAAVILIAHPLPGGITQVGAPNFVEFKYTTTPAGAVARVALMLAALIAVVRIWWTPGSGLLSRAKSARRTRRPRADHDLSAQLSRLADLHASGALNDAEYRTAKARLIED